MRTRNTLRWWLPAVVAMRILSTQKSLPFARIGDADEVAALLLVAVGHLEGGQAELEALRGGGRLQLPASIGERRPPAPHRAKRRNAERGGQAVTDVFGRLGHGGPDYQEKSQRICFGGSGAARPLHD